MKKIATSPMHIRRVAGQTSRPAFSLVELLIVVGIIAVLLALLMPTLSRVRGQARSAQCSNQLHQIYLATLTWRDSHDPTPVPAQGWQKSLLPIIQDSRILRCPEDPLTGQTVAVADAVGTQGSGTGLGAAGTGDTGSGTGGTAQAGAGASAAPPAILPVDLSSIDFQFDTGSAISPLIPVGPPNPWIHQSTTGNTTTYWIEDQGWNNNGGDKDFKDIGISITANPDGTVTVTLLPLSKGVPGYHSSVLMTNADGTTTPIFTDCYKTGAQAGATKTVGTPSGGGGGGAESGGGTASGSSGSSGSSAAGTSSTAGLEDANADYGMNENLNAMMKQNGGDSDKILGMDYVGSVVHITPPDDWNSKMQVGTKSPIFARHNGFANILYGDGSVHGEAISATHLNPAYGDNAQVWWQPKQ